MQGSIDTSGSSRQPLVGGPRQGGELDYARKALRELAALDEVRAAEIEKRLSDGYYGRPHVACVVAAGLAATLSASDL